jgi:hypothetical protein
MNANIFRQITADPLFSAGERHRRLAAAVQLRRRSHRPLASPLRRMQLPNYWEVSSYQYYRPAALDDRLARGGPMLMRAGSLGQNVSISTDARRPWSCRPIRAGAGTTSGRDQLLREPGRAGAAGLQRTALRGPAFNRSLPRTSMSPPSRTRPRPPSSVVATYSATSYRRRRRWTRGSTSRCRRRCRSSCSRSRSPRPARYALQGVRGPALPGCWSTEGTPG